MNPKIAAGLATAFIAGHIVGDIRASRAAAKIVTRLVEHTHVAEMKVKTLVDFVNDVANGCDRYEANRKFQAAKEFIEIVEESI